MLPADPAAAVIAAIVVTYESAATIDDCLMRLRRADGVGQIRVVDNGSVDGTLAIVQRHAASDVRVRFIGNPDNPGFAAACNQGAHDSDARWIAFVNPDCLVEVDTLQRLQVHAAGVDGNALLGADLVDEAGVRDPAARRHAPDFARMLSAVFDGSGARALGVPMDTASMLQQVDAVSGALMLVSRELYQRIDGFDTGYRLHAEDLDLCRRARDAGATVAVANDVRVTHLRGVSSHSRPLFVEWHKHRGLARYFRKFESARRGVPVRLLVYAAIWARFPFAVARAMRASPRSD